MTRPLNAVMRPAGEWRYPSPRLATLRRLEVTVVTALVLLLVVAAGGLAGRNRAIVWLPATAALAVVVIGAGLVANRFAQRRVRAWGYCEREDDLLVQRGVLITRLSVVPFGRMQFIDVVAGPFERSFGLATVRLHTAAAASDARIPGLGSDEAARLRDHLAELGEAKAAGL
ncbi:MAG TPA: PH domain-containing protein [Candidatus Acidoferrales bacterium]|nr:PH domain-containing protein [Candidatus Acidoferrales bacterium]